VKPHIPDLALPVALSASLRVYPVLLSLCDHMPLDCQVRGNSATFRAATDLRFGMLGTVSALWATPLR
jgi:hypothetical protein